MVEGMVEENKFEDKLKYTSEDKPPIDDGMADENLLFPRSR